MTHVGRLDDGTTTVFGKTRESPWRSPRAACGAIVGAISAYNPDNGVHRRLRRDLGEENFEVFLRGRTTTVEGIDITDVVAASIVAVQGMRNVLTALTAELDERGIGLVTASVTVNRVGRPDTLIYLGRGTVFDGQLRTQGFGCSAQRYGGRMVDVEGDRRLELLDDRGGDGADGADVQTAAYAVRRSQAVTPPVTARMPGRKVHIPDMGDTLAEPRRIAVPGLNDLVPEAQPMELPAASAPPPIAPPPGA
jgi:hypothetical protein